MLLDVRTLRQPCPLISQRKRRQIYDGAHGIFHIYHLCTQETLDSREGNSANAELPYPGLTGQSLLPSANSAEDLREP